MYVYMYICVSVFVRMYDVHTTYTVRRTHSVRVCMYEFLHMYVCMCMHAMSVYMFICICLYY